MASFTRREQSESFFATTGARTSPRPADATPVLFRIPNLRADRSHRPQITQESVAPDEPAVTPAAPYAALPPSLDSAPLSTAPQPSFTPIPAPSFAVAPTAQKKPWYATWGNRILILALIGTIGFLALQRNKDSSDRATSALMEKEGIQDSNLVENVEIPSFTHESSQPPTLMASLPNETPIAPVEKTDPKSEPTLELGNPSPTLDESKSADTQPSPPSLLLGSRSSPSSSNDSSTIAPTLDKPDPNKSTGLANNSILDRTLEPPSLVPAPNDAGMASAPPQDSPSSNAVATATPTNATKPALIETDYENLSTEALLAARRTLIQQSFASNSANSASPYRTTSTTPIGSAPNTIATSTPSMPNVPMTGGSYKPIGIGDTMLGSGTNSTQLTGQPYPGPTPSHPGIPFPSNTMAPGGIMAPNSNPTMVPNTTRKPYQPIGASLDSSMMGTGATPNMAPNTTPNSFAPPMNYPSANAMAPNAMAPSGYNATVGAQTPQPGLGLIPGTQPYVPSMPTGYGGAVPNYPTLPMNNPMGSPSVPTMPR